MRPTDPPQTLEEHKQRLREWMDFLSVPYMEEDIERTAYGLWVAAEHERIQKMLQPQYATYTSDSTEWPEAVYADS